MKKEIIVACVLILMLTGAVINIHYLNKLTDTVARSIEEAEKFVKDEDWAKAEKIAEEAVERWTTSDTYTHLVLRHPEIDSTTDGLYSFLEQVYAREPGAAAGAAKAAVARLKSISSIEEIKLGSVF